jgi:hypothetical protein
VEVELDEHRSLTDICNDEESSRDSEHREEHYSLARDREKCDRKAPERYRFEDMVSFALTAIVKTHRLLRMACRQRWSYYIKAKLGNRQNCSRQRKLKGANGSTKIKSQQRKMCGLED